MGTKHSVYRHLRRQKRKKVTQFCGTFFLCALSLQFCRAQSAFFYTMQPQNPLLRTEHDVTIKIDPLTWLLLFLFGVGFILLIKVVPAAS